MKKKPTTPESLLPIILPLIFVAMFFEIYIDDRRPVFLVGIVALVIFASYCPYFLIADKFRISDKKVKVFVPVNAGYAQVNVCCSIHTLVRDPFTIELDGQIVAKIYRGKNIILSIPEGNHTMTAYIYKSDRTVKNIEVRNGMSIFIWFDPTDTPQVQISDADDSSALESSAIEAYINGKKTLRGGAVFMGIACVTIIMVVLWRVFGIFD